MLYAIVALLVIILDQWTKLWVSSNGDLLPYRLIPNMISLVSAENSGGAFNFLAKYNVTVVFIVAAGLVTLLTIIALSTNLVKGGLGRWSLVFVSAGGLSNAIDRLLNQGKVQDMIKLDFLERVNLFGHKGINFPIFNIADIFITVFIFLFILYVLFGGRKKDAGDEAEDDDDEDDFDDEDDDFDDEDEEEDKPVRRKEKKQRRKKAADDEEEAEAKPRVSNYEENYERYKARKAREAAEEKPAPVAKAAPVVDPEDPFAEWERANQKVGKTAAKSAEAAKPAEAPKPAPAAKPAEAPKPTPAAKPAEAPKPAPAPKPVEKPKPAPAPKAPAAAEQEEYNLDDILAEFR